MLILVFRFERVVDLQKLLFAYIKFLFTDFSIAINQFNLVLADHLGSTLIFFLIPVLIIVSLKRGVMFLSRKIFISVFLLILLFFSLLFAPIITVSNPDFYKDISITKLLPPLSSKKLINLKEKNKLEDEAGSFFTLKNKVIKLAYNDNVIYCDSTFISDDELFYYQKSVRKSVSTKLIEVNNNQYASSKLFILGTDEFGRDIFTRLIYGTRLSLFIGFSAVLISFVLGLILGFFAGYKSGWVDLIFNRITDLFLAFPMIFLVIFILALFGNNMISVIVVLGFSGWMSLFKLVKTEVASIKKKDFFISSVLVGVPPFSLMKKEILPLILAPIIVNIVFQFGNVILAESALSYLGLGFGNEFPSWGSMIQSGQQYISQAWWLILLPGILLIITLITINDLGKKLQEYFNPRIKYD